jgi:hypothetical protein
MVAMMAMTEAILLFQLSPKWTRPIIHRHHHPHALLRLTGDCDDDD